MERCQPRASFFQHHPNHNDIQHAVRHMNHQYDHPRVNQTCATRGRSRQWASQEARLVSNGMFVPQDNFHFNFRSHDYDDVVEVLVGAEETGFRIHQYALCSNLSTSPTTRTATACSFWPRGVACGEIFPSYIEWAYANKLELHLDDDDGEPHAGDRRLVTPMKVYQLATQLQHHRLRIEAMEQFIVKLGSAQFGSNTFTPSFTTTFFKTTPPNSPIRKLFADWIVLCGRHDAFVEDTAQHPSAFLADVIRSFMQKVPGSAPGAEAIEKLRASYIPERADLE